VLSNNLIITILSSFNLINFSSDNYEILKKITMLHNNITHTIIGAAMRVHNTLGNGFQEVIYQRALQIEMLKQKLKFAREMEMPLYYDGQEIGTRRVDFFVEEKIMVELKAVIKLDDLHLAQCRNYLEAYNLPVGLLINFGAPSLDYKRVYNSKHPEVKHSNH